MEPLDPYIEKLGKYLENAGKTSQIREIKCPADISQLLRGLPVEVGPQGGANILLKEDTAVELGNPSIASCAFLLWTANLSLIRDGMVTLIGPDIQEAVGQSLPFAQVLIVGGHDLKEQHHLLLEQHHIISNQIEGYVIKLAPQRQRMWARVSKAVVDKGFSFETLGRALMAIYKSELPAIEATEVVFLTSSKDDVKGLENIAVEVQRTKNEELNSRFQREDDGSFVCTSNYVDCRDCPDQVICDDIRDLIRLRRKQRASGTSSK